MPKSINSDSNRLRPFFLIHAFARKVFLFRKVQQRDSSDDAINRIISDGARTLAYSAAGDLVSLVDINGVSTFNYDNADRMISKSDPRGYSLVYGYDAAGRRSSLAISGSSFSRTIIYTYFSDGRLKTIGDGFGSASFVYENSGRLADAMYSNGSSSSYIYQPNNYYLSAVSHFDCVFWSK